MNRNRIRLFGIAVLAGIVAYIILSKKINIGGAAGSGPGAAIKSGGSAAEMPSWWERFKAYAAEH
jgi:hypothetical protein